MSASVSFVFVVYLDGKYPGGLGPNEFLPAGILGNKTSATREVVLFSRGHLGISGSEITATRKLPKWVVFTLQGKSAAWNYVHRIFQGNVRRKINLVVCFMVTQTGLWISWILRVVKLNRVFLLIFLTKSMISVKGKVYLVQLCRTAELFRR